MSEKLGRDAGFRTECIDFLEDVDQALTEYMYYKQTAILFEMGAQRIGTEIRDTISDLRPPKQLVQRRIILPLTEESLSQKHGVTPPRPLSSLTRRAWETTHFVKAIAGIPSW